MATSFPFMTPALTSRAITLRRLRRAEHPLVLQAADAISQDGIIGERAAGGRTIAAIADAVSIHAFSPWGIRRRDDGVLVGAIRIARWHLEHHRADLTIVRFPIAGTAEPMMEAIRSVLAFAVGRLGCRRVECRVVSGDSVLSGALGQTGMQLEARLRGYAIDDGTPVDCESWAILDRDVVAM